MMASSSRSHHRVVLFTTSFAGGGAEHVMVTVANELDSQRFQVAVIALSGEGPLCPPVDDHVRLVVIDRPRVRQAFPRLISLLRRLAPDAVVSSAPRGYHLLAGAKWLLTRRTRIVAREANLPSKALPFSPLTEIFAWGLRRLYPPADAVVLGSSHILDGLCSFGTPAERMHVAPNPVDVERIRRLTDPPIPKPATERRYLSVGRLLPKKGFDRMIRMLGELLATDQLTILGEGPERSRLGAMYEASEVGDRVDLAKFVGYPWAQLAVDDALVVPSRTQGQPNAVRVALACGTPLIAAPAGGGIGSIAAGSPLGAVEIVRIERFPQVLNGLVASHAVTNQSPLPPQYSKDGATDALSEGLLPVAPLALAPT